MFKVGPKRQREELVISQSLAEEEKYRKIKHKSTTKVTFSKKQKYIYIYSL